MIELGQLETHSQEFKAKGIRVFAISNDDVDTAKLTQEKFPHLSIIADPQQTMAKALAVVHEGVAPGGKDTNAPTTFLVNAGEVRWLFRPDSIIERLPAVDLLAAIDGALKSR